MTAGPTWPKSRLSMGRCNTKMIIEIISENRVDAVSNWLAASPASSFTPRPMYWLIMTAPPEASAVNR